jgi:imidazolonepropionase-like amidohydrolase
VREAIDALADAGAAVIKVPFGHGPELRDEELAALVEHAHARGLKVAAHALLDADTARAAALGVDVLAHTPLGPLSDATIRALGGRAVVSTLMAFGGSRVAVDNLRRLHEAGAAVLYGTDLGNSPVLGIDADELALLRRAGLSPQESLDAAPSAAARWWGLEELGTLEPGRAASLLVLDADPLEDPSTLARPHAVWVDGVPLDPA